jgi:hypothetical protein
MKLKFLPLMDQKAIVLYAHMKAMWLDAIHEDLMRVLGENAVAYCMMTKYVHSETVPQRTIDLLHGR